MKNTDMGTSIFISHVPIILQVLGQRILHLTCAYFVTLFAVMQKTQS